MIAVVINGEAVFGNECFIVPKISSIFSNSYLEIKFNPEQQQKLLSIVN
jgi:hypothetical protein